MTVAAAFALFQKGDLAGAEAALHEVLRHAPKDVDACQLLGGVAEARGDSEAALKWFDRAAALAPMHPGIAFNRAGLLLKAQRWPQAEEAFAIVLKHAPGDSEALMGRARALAGMKRHEDAIHAYNLAQKAGVNASSLFANRGAARAALKQFSAALADFDEAIARDPRDAKAHFNRGRALNDLWRPEEGLAAFDAALAVDPNYAEAWNSKGASLLDVDREEEALACFARAIALRPHNAEFLLNPALALIAQNRLDAAEPHIAASLAADPDHADAVFTRFVVMALRGDLADALPLYEARWRSGKVRTRPSYPHAEIWLGEGEVAGKTVLVSGEQGFGDVFQFIRFAPDLARLGARVIVTERAPVLGLLRRVEGVAAVADSAGPLPFFDRHIPVASLPLAFLPRLGAIPDRGAYLTAPAERVAAWRARLGPRDGRARIGVAWSGGKQTPIHARRTLPLAALQQLLAPDFEWISLQFDPGEAAPWLAGRGVRTFGDDIADFEEQAALIANCDAVVAVDTGVAHLAAAGGCPTHILLPFAPDWRWMLQRSDSPWYASVVLHRQAAPGDWSAPIAGAHAALALLRSSGAE